MSVLFVCLFLSFTSMNHFPLSHSTIVVPGADQWHKHGQGQVWSRWGGGGAKWLQPSIWVQHQGDPQPQRGWGEARSQAGEPGPGPVPETIGEASPPWWELWWAGTRGTSRPFLPRGLSYQGQEGSSKTEAWPSFSASWLHPQWALSETVFLF